MSRRRADIAAATAVLCCGILTFAGCRGARTAHDDAPTREILKVLGVEYGRYLADHRGRRRKTSTRCGRTCRRTWSG